MLLASQHVNKHTSTALCLPKVRCVPGQEEQDGEGSTEPGVLGPGLQEDGLLRLQAGRPARRRRLPQTSRGAVMRPSSMEKTLILGMIKGRRRRVGGRG